MLIFPVLVMGWKKIQFEDCISLVLRFSDNN